MKHCWHTMSLKLGNIILITERYWEVNLEHLETVAKMNIVVIILVNPNNPWGVFFNHENLAKIAEMEKKLGLSIIYDGVYALKLFPVAGTCLVT